MSRTPYDRWLKFIARPHSESGLVFPREEAQAITALPFVPEGLGWRRDKRLINRACKHIAKRRRQRVRTVP
jgi:hypothetical protein